MLKHEDWPDLDKLTAVRAREKYDMRRLSILSGNCGVFLPFELARGADGAMTGYAYPEMLVGVCRLMAADAARRMTCLTRTCRWSATSSSPVPVSPCASTCCGVAALLSAPTPARVHRR